MGAFWFGFSPAAATDYDSLVIEIPPGDPCQKLVAAYPPSDIKLPESFSKIRGKMAGKINLDLNKYALVACNDAKERITSAVQAQIDELNPLPGLQAAAEQKARAEVNAIYDGFLHWIAENFEAQLLSDFPDLDDERFQPGTPAADEAALKWAANAGSRIPDIISAYLHHLSGGNNSLIGRAFDDYMSGASQEVINGFGDILGKGQDRMDRFLDAKTEIVEQNADYTDTLRKHGLSGEWVDKLEENEKWFKQLDADYNVVEGLSITYTAIQAEEPDEKIRGFFTLIKFFGDTAESSNIPMVSLVGQIVAAYGDVAVQMLDGLDSLETAMRAREGFCVGLGTHAGRDKREALLADALGQQRSQADIRICPLKPGRKPWADIFYQAQPEDNSKLYFYIDEDGNERFIEGRNGHGGQDAVLEAMRLIRAAETENYAAYEGKNDDLAAIAAVYNVPFPQDIPRYDGNDIGILGVMNFADQTVSTISRQRERLLGRVESKSGVCSGEYLFEELLSRTGLNMFSFPDGVDHENLNRLRARIAVSYVEKTRDFAPSQPRRTQAFDQYAPIAQKIERLSLLQIDGKMTTRNGLSCDVCAGAPMGAAVRNGAEVQGCEISAADAQGRFTVNILTESPNVSVVITADVPDAETDPYRIDMEYLSAHTRVSELPFVYTANIYFPVRIQDEMQYDDVPDRIFAAAADAQSACRSLARESQDALDAAAAWRENREAVQDSRPVSDLSPADAKQQMSDLLTASNAAASDAETQAAKTCSFAKDSSAAFVTTQEERTALYRDAQSQFTDFDASLETLRRLTTDARSIAAQNPGDTAPRLAGLADRPFEQIAASFLLAEPNLSETAQQSLERFSDLRGVYTSFKNSGTPAGDSFSYDFEENLSRLEICVADATDKAEQARRELDSLGAAPAETAPGLAPEWADIEKMMAQIEQNEQSIQGLRTETQICLGDPPEEEQEAVTGHDFLEGEWMGVQRLMRVYVKTKAGTFSCSSLQNCVGETNRWMQTETSRDPEDQDWNRAIGSAIKQFFGLLFDGLQAGLVIDANSDGSFTISSGDVGFGDMTAQSVTVRQEDSDLFMGNETVTLEGIGPAKIGADILIRSETDINIKTYLSVKNAEGEFEVDFDSDLTPGVLDAEAIKAANMAAFSSIRVD